MSTHFASTHYRSTHYASTQYGGVAVPPAAPERRRGDIRPSGHRAKEPFDLGYWRETYGKKQQAKVKRERAERDAQRIQDELEAAEAKRQREAELFAELDELLQLELQEQAQRAELNEELDGLLEDESLDAASAAQADRMAELQRTRTQLREALTAAENRLEMVHEGHLLYLDWQRRQRNNKAAAIAAIDIYFT